MSLLLTDKSKLKTASTQMKSLSYAHEQKTYILYAIHPPSPKQKKVPILCDLSLQCVCVFIIIIYRHIRSDCEYHLINIQIIFIY